LEVVLPHVPADDVVGVFLLLVDAVYGLVGLLLLVAAFLGLVLVGCRADDGHFHSEWLQRLQLALSYELEILGFVGGL